jgi:hypothetical protein
MHFIPISLLLTGWAAATLTIQDPSDSISGAAWAADNAVLADYNVQPLLYQIIPVVGPYVFNGTTTAVDHQYYTVDANDTSVVIITEGSNVTITYSEIVKFGYASNLLQSSFFGKSKTVLMYSNNEETVSHYKLQVSMQQSMSPTILLPT